MKNTLTIAAALMFLAGCATVQTWDNPDSVRFKDAEQKYLLGDFAAAAEMFAEIAELPGSDARALSRFWEGKARLESRDFAAAEASFAEALAENPPRFFRGEALFGIGRACFGLQKFDEAGADISAALSETPDSIQTDFARLVLGHALLRSGRWDEGMKNLEAAAEIGKNSESAAEAKSSLAFRDVRKFTIQTGAFSVKQVAESEAARLSKSGLDAWIHPLGNTGAKGQIYAVCVGKFDDWRAAIREAGRIRGLGLVSDAIVKP